MHVIYDDGNGCYDFEQYDLLQDRSGYLWIAGNSGAFKYTAKQFQHFESRLSPSRALTGLCQDNYNRIWMHDFAGNVFYEQQDELVLFPLWKAQSSKTFPVLRSHGQRFWIIAEESISEYINHQQTGCIRLSRKWKTATSREATVFQNQLYVSGEEEILLVGKHLKKIPIEGKHQPQFLKAWTTLFVMNKHLFLFVRSENTVYELRGTSFRKVKTMESISDFIALRVIRGRPWLLTRDGLTRLSPHFEPVEHLFRGFACSDILQDKQGNYWLSTLNKGIVLIPDIRTRIFTNPGSSGFTKLMPWNQRLIAGTNDGKLYQIAANHLSLLYESDQQKEISFLAQNQHTGTCYFGDCKLYERGSTLRSLGTNPSIKQVEFLSADLALIADPGGLYIRSFTPGKFIESTLPDFLKGKGKPVKIAGTNADLYVLLEERTSRFFYRNHQLLAATKNGLYLINKKEKKVIRFQGNPIFATDFEWGNGLLYVATSNLGLLSWDGKTWEKVLLDESLTPFTFIQHVSCARGQLWMATDAGIIQYDPKHHKQQVIDQSNGLITTRITDMTVFNGSIFLSTAKGILKFPITFQIDPIATPPLYFAHLKINGKTVETTQLEHIESNPGIVSLQFDALLYGNSNRLILGYRLDNENKWINLNPGSFTVNLTKFQAGEHLIRIRLIDRVTGKTLQNMSLKAYVHPTFFQRTSVRIGMIVSAILLLAVFTWWYIGSMKRKNHQLLEKERLERELKQSMLSAIKAQMNPHFIFNALNTIQSYVLTNDRMQANFYLGKFSDLMRRILNMSNQDAVTLEEEIDALTLYLELENMRLNNELEVVMDTGQISDLLHKRIPSMIIQPYLENAIKHGLLHFSGRKKLEIRFIPSPHELLEVQITDYGIGRPASFRMKQRHSNRHKSFSTEANKKRLDLLNEQNQDGISITVIDLEASETHTGTRVILRIPFK
jgi:ligand-binding sensor domain-containing protein